MSSNILACASRAPCRARRLLEVMSFRIVSPHNSAVETWAGAGAAMGATRGKKPEPRASITSTFRLSWGNQGSAAGLRRVEVLGVSWVSLWLISAGTSSGFCFSFGLKSTCESPCDLRHGEAASDSTFARDRLSDNIVDGAKPAEATGAARQTSRTTVGSISESHVRNEV